jgi:cytochrome bd ubiquinol oxidase subunit I
MTNINYSLVEWSRAQFALTAIYHWFFVPLTLGLSLILAIMETIYYRTKDEKWKQITKFWMKLFAINFVIGVATGIILEFEFGTNWSSYSWLVGDIFGTPLAIEGIMAFFLESTFVVLMLFGWNKISKSYHLTSTWLVYVGTNLSALWILVANAWMQYPTGMYFNPDSARSEMIDFWAVLLSPMALNKFFHTVTSSYLVAALFVTGISSWYLLKNRNKNLALKSIKVAALLGLIASLLTAMSGDRSGYQVSQKQPMKLAAMEGLYRGQTHAGLIWLGMINPSKKPGDNKEEYIFKLQVPDLLSILAYKKAESFVPGIDDILYGNPKEGIESSQEKIEKGKVAIKAMSDYKEAKKKGDIDALNNAYYDFLSYSHLLGYGYINNAEELVPSVPTVFYSFRIMVGLGLLFIVLFVIILIFNNKELETKRWLLKTALWAIPFGYIASVLGWVVTEVGRQPWAIQDILPVTMATSHIHTSAVITTFFVFLLLFTILLIAEIKIMITQIKKNDIN